MPKIYFIIVTYNAIKWAERCFSSLRRSSIPVQIIVVDNGSTDGSQDYIKENFPEVDLIQSAENLGFGKANNLGIEKAYRNGADFFYLMNQDAWLFENSLEKLIEVYENYPIKEEIGIISPMHLDGTEKKLDLHFENYLGKNAKINRLVSELYFHQQSLWYEIDFVNAAHWFVPKETIEKIGGFNPYFFHGAEDYDYVNRLKYFSKKLLVATESKVVHDTVQAFHKKIPQNKEELLVQTRISLRMQRETRYLDPNFNFHIKNEKREFYSNILKLNLRGNFSESKYYKEQYNYFSKKFNDIETYRKTAMTEKNAFLNLNKTD